MWMKADAGVYNDYWTTKTTPSTNGSHINTWENQALVPGNDILASSVLQSGTSNWLYRSSTSANAINFNPTTDIASASPGIFRDADNGVQDNYDYYGYTNGLAYIAGSHTDFVVGSDSSIAGTEEALLTYGYENGSGLTTGIYAGNAPEAIWSILC
jgi:hypothetical protein